MKIFTTRVLPMLLATCLAGALHAQPWTQIGADIDGEAASDKSGYAVSMPDAYTICIGSPENDGGGSNIGQVRVYSRTGTIWTQKGADINGEAAGDKSGSAVSMPDANTMAIGAPRNAAGGTNAGHVRVYSWSGTAWVQKGADIDGLINDQSGISVSMPDANTVAVGAPYGTGQLSGDGSVRVYKWNGSAWVQKGSSIFGQAQDQYAGTYVDMPDSNTVAFGAPGASVTAPNTGQTRVYQWVGNAWVQKGASMEGEGADDYSGSSISMPDVNTVAIGAFGNDNDTLKIDAGHVRVYTWNGSAWAQKGSDIDAEAAYDGFGTSVSMPSANMVAIGAVYNYNGTLTEQGHVRVFEWNGTAWVQLGADIDGEGNDDQFGISVCMPDENTLGAGSWLNDGTAAGAGHARVFQFCPSSIATITEVACMRYTSPSGHVYTVGGFYQDTIPNMSGCDSIITIGLTVNTVDATVALNGSTVTSNAVGATYQWLDCGNGMAVIPGETGQSYSNSAGGSFAVAVTQNGCTDTSACEVVTRLESTFANTVSVHPNPAHGKVNLAFSESQEEVTVSLCSITGQVIESQTWHNTSSMSFETTVAAGFYLLKISSDEQLAVVRLIME